MLAMSTCLVVRRIENLKSLSAWKTNVSETNIILNKFSSEYNSKMPEFTVAIDDGLGYTIKVYDWYIPEDHSIYSIYHRSMKNVTVSNLVHTLVSYFKCPGITYVRPKKKKMCGSSYPTDPKFFLCHFPTENFFSSSHHS